MFVCICNAYRDKDIAHAARSGAGCAHEAYEALGSGPNCGCCLDAAEEIVRQARAPQAAGAPCKEEIA